MRLMLRLMLIDAKVRYKIRLGLMLSLYVQTAPWLPAKFVQDFSFVHFFYVSRAYNLPPHIIHAYQKLFSINKCSCIYYLCLFAATATKVRDDNRCEPLEALTPDHGYKAICDGSSDKPCCSYNGYCDISDDHCKCDTCKDYRRESCFCLLFYTSPHDL